MEDSSIKIVARWITLAALFLIPFTPLIVANSYFFPFITGKAFFFRILVEIAFAAWVVLALIDKKYRPRWSWISVILVAFVVWMFIADLFAVNPQKAFWSNFERMEGWITLLHLLLFFVVASTVLRVEKLWRSWWYTSIGVAALVGAYGVAQLGCSSDFFIKTGAICQNFGTIHQGGVRLDASLGNATYLAVYMLFHTFIAGWLALTTKRRWLKYTLLSFAVFFAFILFSTATRGTILGLAGGLFLAALLSAFTMGKRARWWAGGAVILLLLIGGGFWAAKDTGAIRHDPILGRIASISLSAGQTRFTIWHMAFDGFTESPKTVVLGWGQEGYNYVFNTYYEPSLYAQEQWFDRAHNAFVDWFVEGGLPAGLLYLGLFISMLFMLWRAPFSRKEQIIFTALLAGYAFHNLFVFDNITSYIAFIAVLAFVESTAGKPVPAFERAPVLTGTGARGISGALVAALLALTIFTLDAPGMAAASGLITALSPQQNGIKGSIAAWKWEATHSAFASQEVREQLLVFAEQAVRSRSIPNADKLKIATLAITQMQKEVQEVPFDARLRFELAIGYASFGNMKEALAQISIARKLSPKKESIILQEGLFKLQQGDKKGANADFQTAYTLAPCVAGHCPFSDLAAYGAAGDVLVGKEAAAVVLLKEAFGTTTVDKPILAEAYVISKNYAPLLALYKERAAKRPNATTTVLQLAVIYAKDKQPVRAVAVIRAFVKTHPAAADAGARLIKDITQGKIK